MEKNTNSQDLQIKKNQSGNYLPKLSRKIRKSVSAKQILNYTSLNPKKSSKPRIVTPDQLKIYSNDN